MALGTALLLCYCSLLPPASSAGPSAEEEAATRFAAADLNSDNELTFGEAAQAFRASIVAQTEADEAAITAHLVSDAREVFNEVDTNGDGLLTYKELSRSYLELLPHMSRGAIRISLHRILPLVNFVADFSHA